MGVLYDQAEPEVHEMARKILEEHHKELKMPDGTFVRLCILMAFQKDKNCDEPAVVLHGYPCAAKVSIIPYKQRVDKRADAEIIIDQQAWDRMSLRRQQALLDHEITHITFEVDELGAVKTDDVGRPKLTLRLHDFELGGFSTVARRYGLDALEVIAAMKFRDDFGKDLLLESIEENQVEQKVTLAPEKEEEPSLY